MSFHWEFTIGARETQRFYRMLALEKWGKGIAGFGLVGALTAWMYTVGGSMSPAVRALAVLGGAAAAMALLMVCLAGAAATRINYDILTYLPPDLDSSQGEKPTTLEEYASRMKEDQKAIYYACGQSREQLEHLPQTELVKEKGYEILYLTDDVDEFCVRALGKYGEHDFKSVSDGDLDLASQEEKDQVKEQNDKEKELLDCMKAALGDQVKEVRLSVRLKTGPVCLTTDGGITLEMEKVFAQMPGGEEKLKAERVLELNGGHPVFQKLQGLYQAGEKELVGTYAQLLYAQAQLLEGLQLEDPVAFSKALGDLLGR